MIKSCITNPNNITPNTEGGRIALLLEAARRCAATQALAKARGGPVGRPCAAIRPPMGVHVPPASAAIANKTACLTFVSANKCTTESSWIARIQRETLDAAKNPLDPTSRFSAYVRPFPPPICAAVPQEALNANVPHSQAIRCPLPNRSDLPVLPG